MDANAEDQNVFVGIRPEGFIYAPEDGVLSLDLSSVEVMGRDCSVVSTHCEAESVNIRSIIDSDINVDMTSSKVRFNLKPNKVFVFNAKTEERIQFKNED